MTCSSEQPSSAMMRRNDEEEREVQIEEVRNYGIRYLPSLERKGYIIAQFAMDQERLNNHQGRMAREEMTNL